MKAKIVQWLNRLLERVFPDLSDMAFNIDYQDIMADLEHGREAD